MHKQSSIKFSRQARLTMKQRHIICVALPSIYTYIYFDTLATA